MIDDLWYKNAVFYCLAVGTYMDANGDGIGDFIGLTRRLDYLHGLGVTAIWLMPFQPSPQRDGGYDIADYCGVDPRYGTLGDFVEFTHGCKQRGIRVIIDLVVNHTSDQHPWFQDARRSKDSPYRGWYVWSDKKPANAESCSHALPQRRNSRQVQSKFRTHPVGLRLGYVQQVHSRGRHCASFRLARCQK